MNKPESEMVLVPREPTQAMLDAVQTKRHPTRPDGWSDRHAHLFREMVAAFPEGAEAAQLLGEIEQEFVVLKDLPAFIRRMQDEIRAARAAAHPSNQVLQEPVAWMKAHSCGIGTFTDNPAAAQAWAVLGSPLTPLYASPQAVPSEQPIAEQPKSDKANLMVAVGSDLPPATAKKRTFSDFIRNATPEEKEAVYDMVMERAAARRWDIASQNMNNSCRTEQDCNFQTYCRTGGGRCMKEANTRADAAAGKEAKE